MYYKQFFTSFEKKYVIEKNCLLDPWISIRVSKNYSPFCRCL